MTQGQTTGKFDIKALVAASSATARAIQGVAGLPVAAIDAAITEAQRQAQAQVDADVVVTMVEINRLEDNMIAAAAAKKAEYLKLAEFEQARIDNVARGRAYSAETNNVMPRIVYVGLGNAIDSSVPESERKIPKDWTPSPAEVSPQ